MALLEGLTTFGTPQSRGIVGMEASTRVLNAPGMLLFKTNNAGTVQSSYVWVDSSGTMRISNVLPTNQDADGTVVGTQT